MSFGFIANMLFTCLRCYSEGMGLTLPVFWVAFIGMLLNIPLDIIFVYGYFGIPPMGGVGCGIATSINIIIGLLVLMLILAISFNPSWLSFCLSIVLSTVSNAFDLSP